MSLTTDAFEAARRDLASYKPDVDLLPAIGFAPQRARPPLTPAPSIEHQAPLPGRAILDTAARLRDGHLRCDDLLTNALDAVEHCGPTTGAVVFLLEESARRQAAELDAELGAGRWRGPLHGIPITVKDNIHVAGAPTRAGSDAHLKTPAEDAECVALLKRAGAVVVAKVATHEFALGVTTPQARHPADGRRIPGGSSGGSAISIATGMAMGSLGTDTRASIRVPSSLCGVAGFKPTYGTVPAGGVVWLSWTMDHVGALAGSVTDAACLLAAASPQLAGLVEQPLVSLEGWRVGVPEAGFAGASQEVARAAKRALQRLESHGVQLVETAYPSERDFALANAAGLIVSRAEALSYHRSLGTDLARVWPETADQLRIAETVGAAEYLDAQRFRQDLAARLAASTVQDGLAALCMPATLVTAPLVSEAERYFTLLSRNAIPWSLIGWPAVSVPCPVDEGSLPAGLQIVAPPFEDASLVQLGTRIEGATA